MSGCPWPAMVVVGSGGPLCCAGREPVQDPRARTHSVPAGTPICEGRTAAVALLRIGDKLGSSRVFEVRPVAVSKEVDACL